MNLWERELKLYKFHSLVFPVFVLIYFSTVVSYCMKARNKYKTEIILFPLCFVTWDEIKKKIVYIYTATTENSSLSSLLDFILNLFLKKKKKKKKKTFPFIFFSFPC